MEVDLEAVIRAKTNLEGVIRHTPLELNPTLSIRYGANIFLKREDLQPVRSYKIRGAFNFIVSLSELEREKGVVCASAGNHAQGVAYTCNKLGIKGIIFMPITTPNQKIDKTRTLGGDFVEVKLVGDTFDESNSHARTFQEESGAVFVHPFNDLTVIAGQATVGVEILEQFPKNYGVLDYLLIPIGGGGLFSGVGSYVRKFSPNTKLFGVEPEGAASMKASLKDGKVVCLDEISKFVDGAAVKQVGDITYNIVSSLIGAEDVLTVPDGRVCTTVMDLYQNDAIVAEPAGALSIAALNSVCGDIKGKNVVCVLSGGNNDLERIPEIKERSLIFEGKKHYFIINFPQRPGALRQFLEGVLIPGEDITQFQYTKKTAREFGPALVGIEIPNKDEYRGLIDRLTKAGFEYEHLNANPLLLSYFV